MNNQKNNNSMRKAILSVTAVLLSGAILVSCGGGAKDEKGGVGDLKTKLEKLRKEKDKLESDIKNVEEQLAKADPKSANVVKKLVAVDTVRIQNFSHYIDLQGKISSSGIGYVAPKGMGGLVRAIYIKVGQKVSAGQVVLKLDDVTQKQALVAAQLSLGQLKTRLAQAQTVYERYQNLWKQNIGAEINVINAKADVDALAAQLRAAQAQVSLSQEAVSMTNVTAGMSGVVEQINVRVGEQFVGATQQGGQIVVVNNSSLKVEVPVPDNYVAKVKKGDKVIVSVPETGRAPFESSISVVGASINPTTRSFLTEAKLPADPMLKPNQTAIMKILDYESKAAIAVPVNVVQSDEKGKFVYVMEKTGDKLIAKKRAVNVGEAYDGKIEIKGGLSGGDILITEGYQALYDGQTVDINGAKK